jgi:hypothetical protein
MDSPALVAAERVPPPFPAFRRDAKPFLYLFSSRSSCAERRLARGRPDGPTGQIPSLRLTRHGSCRSTLRLPLQGKDRLNHPETGIREGRVPSTGFGLNLLAVAAEARRVTVSPGSFEWRSGRWCRRCRQPGRHATNRLPGGVTPAASARCSRRWRCAGRLYKWCCRCSGRGR